MRAARLFAEGNSVVACEAALIFETDGEGRFDYIVVVDADRERRLARAASRDGACGRVHRCARDVWPEPTS